MDTFSGKLPHQPLSTSDPSEIRIIKLFPGNFGDEVRCELEHVSLDMDDRLPFAAVSYCWGDPRGTKTIFLNRQSYPVTENLYAFLQHAQSILTAIAKHLPLSLGSRRQESILLTQHIIYCILQDLDFPLDFPSTPDSTVSDLVKRNIGKVLDTCVAQDSEQLGSSSDLLALFQFPSEPHEPGNSHLRLWIDALCINQQDLDERSKQVGRMRDIYGKATSLIIWPLEITTTGSHTQAVAKLAHDLHIIIEPHLDGAMSWPEVMDRITSDSFLEPRLQAVQKFRQIITQNWFRRMWIIQEVATATGAVTVLLGFHPIQWPFLTHIMFACCGEMSSGPLQTSFLNDAKSLSTLNQLEREYKELNQQRNELDEESRPPAVTAERLKRLLQQTSGLFKSSVPHDHLYALLGLLGVDGVPQEIYPDYSTPFETVFHKYAIYLIKHTRDVSCLLSYRRELTGVPSWVPDWRYESVRKTSSSPKLIGSAHVEVSGDGLFLEVDGVFLGSIVTLVCPINIKTDILNTGFYRTSDDTEQEEEADSVETAARAILTIFRGMQRLKSLCYRHLTTAFPRLSLSNFNHHWENLWKVYHDDTFGTIREMLEGTKEVDLAILMEDPSGAILLAIGSEILIMSVTGLGISTTCGMVMSNRDSEPTQVGDIICQFNGVGEPCILRQEGPHHRLVSVCRLSSFREEIIEERLFGDCEVRRFVLV